jgi:hypothetical protein
MSFFNGDILASSSDGIVLKDLGTAATNPSSGYGTLYINSNKLYFKNNDGGSYTTTDLTSGGSTTISGNTTEVTSIPSTDETNPTSITNNSIILFNLTSTDEYVSYYINITGTPSNSFICRIFLENTSGSNQYITLYISGQTAYGSSTLASATNLSIVEGRYVTLVYNPGGFDSKWYYQNEGST